MSLDSKINLNQLKALIIQRGIEEKIEILRMLEKDTPPRFKQLLKKIRSDDLTLEEITTEVEIIREKRFSAVDSGK